MSMQAGLRLGARWVAWVLIAGVAVWLAHDRFAAEHERQARTTVVSPEVPIVMRTAGGLLEVATVKAFERFTRKDTRSFWGLDLGTTVSQIQVTAVYRYHIAMAREWPLSIDGTTCVVRAGPVRPSLPVAFDSTSLQKYSVNGWARFNRAENLETLERSMTPALQARAPAYLDLAREAGRKTIAEFVTTWLVKERDWKRDPLYKVVVLYDDEPASGIDRALSTR